ncbi:MAG: kinetochore-associated Ndc80 complex subunit ndc80 [Chrysothrix sp. TS-e1954]|nr:MAG: kinetochore-associated Ndc80 complex subunit ndc80 [Chrysothrix sp. TS-e1954]
MAHEAGPFSVRRPRETLGGLSHNASAIPLPASAMKRSNSSSGAQQAPHTANHARSMSGSRMSLAPGRPSQPMFQRSSSGGNLTEMGTAQRHSSSNAFGGRKSYAPVPQTPAHSTSQQMGQSTQRRSSIYSARHSSSMGQTSHQSFFATAPIPAGVPKDPRPLRDRSYQAQIGQELMDYLTQNNFEMEMKHSLTQNSLRSPTQKDFNNMFQWLYQRIDPSYKFYKSIENEVPLILKQLRYPFEKSITKSQISAVGGQTWATFLGMLHWLMQLARMMDSYASGVYDDACAEAGFDVSGDRIVFRFLGDSYHEWLAMEDDQDDQADAIIKPHVDAMAAEFDKTNAKYLEQVQMLEAEEKALQERIDSLGESATKVGKLNEQIRILEEDRGKFENYNQSMQGKVDKYEGKVKLIQDEIEKIEHQLLESETEKAELQAAVDKQGMTVQDIDRRNTERERLQKGVEEAQMRLEDARRQMSEKEVDAGSRLDALERMIRDYNSLGYQIGIIPKTATNAKGQEHELSLIVNPAPNFKSSRSRRDNPEPERLLQDANNGYQPQHLLNLDLKGSTKNNLLSMRKEISERKNVAAEANMNHKDLLDKAREAYEDKQQEVEGLGHRVRAAQEEFEKTREITNAQKLTSDAQVEKLEKELASMRTTLTENIQLMEQREMNTNIEYEQLTLRANSLREEMHTEIERMLNDIIRFKIHIQKGLQDYEEFVAEEEERERDEAQHGDEQQQQMVEEE